ncbi:MAG: DEAD/DEAH box helicase [Thermodesulfobacteriota bacterium]
MDSRPEWRIEYHRDAIALFPTRQDANPGVAVWIRSNGLTRESRYCSCRQGSKKTCAHIKELSKIIGGLQRESPTGEFDTTFRNSLFHQLVAVMFEISRVSPRDIRLDPNTPAENGTVSLIDAKEMPLLTYYPDSSSQQSGVEMTDAELFCSRCCPNPEGTDDFRRLPVLHQMAALTMSPTERLMLERGAMTRRCAMEEGLWYKVMYHLFRRTQGRCFPPRMNIHPENGSCSLVIADAGDRTFLRIFLPRDKAPMALGKLKSILEGPSGIPIHPHPAASIVRMRLNKRRDLVLQHYLHFRDETGAEHYFERKALEPFRYNQLFFLKDRNVFIRLAQPDPISEKFRNTFSKVVRNKNIPLILEQFGDDIWKPPHIVDDSVRNMRIFRTFERIEIEPVAMERDWYWLSVQYGVGGGSISLQEILDARKHRQRFLPIREGWLDCQSFQGEGLAMIERIFQTEAPAGPPGTYRISAMDLYRLQAAGSLEVKGESDPSDRLRRLLELKPSASIPECCGMTSKLRGYQQRGAEWLFFLFENRFGGLLCDDMGLGKTHQLMALMTWLLEHSKTRKPFLVVCPTTVISHWMRKIREHAPGLKTVVYHGGDRELKALDRNTVLLTSYGVLRRDLPLLMPREFTLAVFDEAQFIKNPETKAYEAAARIRAEMKVGATGTPIENRLDELKVLMDLVIPGYLGTDAGFQQRYAQPIAQYPTGERSKELRRLISPFTLRRLKTSVLDELPPKIEDLRFCSLSEDQVRLYNDAIQSKGRRLLQILRQGEQNIPYLHIFALLNILKQICNHPALLKDRPEEFSRYESGKWEAFKELLSLSLESGQKIVVYSQYLGMIRMIRHYLDQEGIPSVVLTGSSRNRGAIIDRFNNDADCRVFVGSLKAGGVGIDLVSASVVIHYDRWWNAAREDQATDRVHRIGQSRGVQVFKLVTQGTLEEKIAAIIARKRNLLDTIVKEDDPEVVKAFSREQLMDFLSVPTS